MALLLTEAAKLSNDVVLLRRPLHNRHCRTPTPRHPRESGRVSSLPGGSHPCTASDSLRDTGLNHGPAGARAQRLPPTLPSAPVPEAPGCPILLP